jgi:hypothetical protein
LFADLVFNEEGEPARAVNVGNVPHYVVPDGDFLRHVEAEHVDRQIVAALQERMQGMKDAITDGVAHLLGGEGLFARPVIEHAIENLDRILESDALDVDELRTALWMSKFRAVVNVHGKVVKLETPDLDVEPD